MGRMASAIVPEATPGSASGYRTAPDHETTAWPPGVPYIVGNEACERFSFYGMRAILYAHLVSLYVLALQVQDQIESLGLSAAQLNDRAKDLATSTTHLFNAGVYALPMIGAIIADRWVGKYRTILWLSLVYCAGHAVLAVAENTLGGMYLGLGLIAVGSGGIKPCVSANVGDQFGRGNWFRVRTIFQIFYFSINFGSFFSTLLIPWVRERHGAGVAFAIPGILMFIATVLFWMGRRKFVHVPPRPGGRIGLLDACSSVALFMIFGHLFFTAHQPWWVMLLVSAGFLVLGLVLFGIRQRLAPDDGFLAVTLYALRQLFVPDARRRSEPAEATDAPLARNAFWGPAVARFGLEATEGPVAVLKVISVFFLVSVFWALFDQHSSSWIRQANMMDLTLWGDTKVLATQVPALNPLMVMLLIPFMNWVYGVCERLGIQATSLRRMTAGMFLTSLSFVVVALLQQQIDTVGEGKVWFAWQVLPYLLITIGEVMVSITGLEFAYTQAPRKMKSIIMGFYMLTVALGNVLVALLAEFGKLPLTTFFWVFAGLMAAAALLFGIRSYFYQLKDYPQE